MTARADFFTGIGIVIFSAIMFAIAGQMAKPQTYGLGPGGYPMLVTGTLAVLGAILAVQGWIGLRRQSADKTRSDKKSVTLAQLKGIALLAFSFWAYVFLMKYLGFLLTTPFFLFLFLWQYHRGTTASGFDRRTLVKMIALSIIATVVSWALFTHVFLILLPGFYFL